MFLSGAGGTTRGMVCLACHEVTSGRLCRRCEATLWPAPDRLIDGIRVVAGFEHQGAAKVMIHHLKYRGVIDLAGMVADRLEGRLPRVPLVPVPRALTRRVRYGVDPARVIAESLARRLGVPVIDALARPLHAPRRAGRDHSIRVAPFRLRRRLRFEVLVVDDVITTGATVKAAVDAIGVDLVRSITAANVVPEPSNLGSRVTGPKPGVDRVWQAF